MHESASICAVGGLAWRRCAAMRLRGCRRGVHGAASRDSSRTTDAFTRQGGGRRGGGASGGPIGGTLTPAKADERGWGWQVKAMMNPATPRPLYNRAKERLLQDKPDHQLHDLELRPRVVLRGRQALRLHLVRDAAQHDVVRRGPAHAAGVPAASAPRRCSACRMPSNRASRKPPTSGRSVSSCRP